MEEENYINKPICILLMLQILNRLSELFYVRKFYNIQDIIIDKFSKSIDNRYNRQVLQIYLTRNHSDIRLTEITIKYIHPDWYPEKGGLKRTEKRKEIKVGVAVVDPPTRRSNEATMSFIRITPEDLLATELPLFAATWSSWSCHSKLYPHSKTRNFRGGKRTKYKRSRYAK